MKIEFVIHQLLAILLLISFAVDSIDGYFVGLNSQGLALLSNYCKIKAPKGTVVFKPLFCQFVNTDIDSKSYTKYICVGQSSEAVECDERPTGALMPGHRCKSVTSYNFTNLKLTPKPMCEKEDPSLLPAAMGRNICKGQFTCNDKMECPDEIQKLNTGARCIEVPVIL